MSISSISKFIDNVLATINVPVKGKHELIPSVLLEKLNKKGVEIIWQPIPNWNSFESGSVDWGINEFLTLINFKNGDKLQILSDSSYKRDEVIIYSETDYRNIENDYADRYREEFFQPLDYVIAKNKDQLILIHHNGLIAFFNSNAAAHMS